MSHLRTVGSAQRWLDPSWIQIRNSGYWTAGTCIIVSRTANEKQTPTMQIVQSPIIRLVLSVCPNCMLPLRDWLIEAACLCFQVCQPIRCAWRVAGGEGNEWVAGEQPHRRTQSKDSMNLFVIMALISFLFLQASCGALLNCESRNGWDREYNGGFAYQKCVDYRDREQGRLYDRLFW